MRTAILILLLNFFVTQAHSQQVIKDKEKMERFQFEGGLFIPQGNLKSKIGVSQQYSFWYRTKVEHNDMMDFGISLIVPRVNESFVYRGKDSIFNVKAKGISIMLGCRMNKEYPIRVFTKKLNLELSSTFGASFFSFEDKENPEDTSGYYADPDGTKAYHVDTNTKALSALYMAQGIGLTANGVGIHLDYNFIPYSWFTKRIDNDFGKSSLSMVVNYKF